MSEVDQLFKKAIELTKKKKGKYTLELGIVKSIDGDVCIVDDHEDVRLNSVIESLDSQFTVYPKIGSHVIIGRIEGEDDCFVVKFSEIEKVIIKIGNQIFEMKDGKFTIKNGNVSLKTILNEAFLKLKTASVIVGGVPGTFSPADVAAFEQINTKVNQLLD